MLILSMNEWLSFLKELIDFSFCLLSGSLKSFQILYDLYRNEIASLTDP
jgi:hypothetical protein